MASVEYACEEVDGALVHRLTVHGQAARIVEVKTTDEGVLLGFGTTESSITTRFYRITAIDDLVNAPTSAFDWPGLLLLGVRLVKAIVRI